MAHIVACFKLGPRCIWYGWQSSDGRWFITTCFTFQHQLMCFFGADSGFVWKIVNFKIPAMFFWRRTDETVSSVICGGRNSMISWTFSSSSSSPSRLNSVDRHQKLDIRWKHWKCCRKQNRSCFLSIKIYNCLITTVVVWPRRQTTEKHFASENTLS